MALTKQDYIDAADRLDVCPATIRAVVEVETGPHGGFLDTGEPVILYEPHIFHRLTDGRHAGLKATIRGRVYDLSYAKWKRGEYGPVSIQHQKLQVAVTRDREAALQSCSWGLFQIMGFNWKAAGFDSLQEFINAMYAGERGHLDAFVGFIESEDLGKYLRAREWNAFLYRYNGPGYKKNNYHIKLPKAFEKYA